MQRGPRPNDHSAPNRSCGDPHSGSCRPQRLVRVAGAHPSGLRRVPRLIRALSFRGGVTVDLRCSMLPAGPAPTEIHVWCVAGLAEILIPSGVYVEVECCAELAPGAGGPPPSGKAPWLRIIGRSLFGRILVR